MLKRLLVIIFLLTAILLTTACSIANIIFGDLYDSPYGINAHLPDDTTLDLITAAGIKWVRMSISWALIEEAQGIRNWGFVDERVRAALDRGLAILMTVSETPAWASQDGGVNAIPEDKSEWKHFMKEASERYPEIRYWGIWNEPNGGGGEYFSGTPAEFRESILIPGIEGIKEGNPHAKSVAPGITIHTNWSQWMSGIITDDTRELIDVISVHLYVNGDVDDLFWNVDERADNPGDILPLENVLKQLHIEDKPIWLEETGWSTWGADSVSEEVQGQYYRDLLRGVDERECIDKVFPYEMIDDPEADRGFGILNSDYSPKEAYYSYQSLLNETE